MKNETKEVPVENIADAANFIGQINGCYQF